MIKEQVKNIPNWKSPGPPEGFQSYWLKKLTTLHEHLAKQMDNVVSNIEGIPKWMTLSKTGFFCQKDPSKGNSVDNYRPIPCLPLMWKLMTRTIAESNILIFLICMISYWLNKKDAGKKLWKQRSIINQ